MCVRHLVEARNYGLYHFEYGYYSSQRHWFASEETLPPELCGALFMKDLCTFIGLHPSNFILNPIHCIIKLGRARTFFFIYFRLYFSERRKSSTPRMAWGWVNHGVFFIFGWTIPLMHFPSLFVEKSSVSSLGYWVILTKLILINTVLCNNVYTNFRSCSILVYYTHVSASAQF